MKILFVIDTLTTGGKERRLTELMKALSLNSDVEFELVLMSTDVHYHEVYELGIKIHFFIRRTRKDLSIFSKFFKLCKIFSPDIVHCWDSMTAVYITPVCKLLRIKLVNGMVIDAPSRRNIFYQPWLRARLTFPFADLVIGNSNAGLKAYKAPDRKSVVIYNGFDFERISNLTPRNKIIEQLNISTRYIVGMIAAYSEFKDYSTYFKAAQMLLEKRQDITFIAIGKDTDSTAAQNSIDLKNKEFFRLLGRKYGIESFVNVLDVGVLSTFTEGISNSILEYMALGKPVVATAGGGTCEIVEDQETGFLVSMSNPTELAEKLEILLNDKELGFNMGNKGKARIKEVFSIENMTKKYISVYENLINQ